MELLVAIAVFAIVVAFVAAPLRRGVAETEAAALQGRRADLEARKEAKYREIRDAELDHRTGKLSDADWRALDVQLRREAITILRQLDDIGESRP